MNSKHVINLPERTYQLLQQLSQNNGQTINEVIINLIYEQGHSTDLTTGLDAVPSILVKQLEADN